MVQSPVNGAALQRALDEGKLDHAVHLLMLLLGDPLSGPQKRRFATLQRAVAQTAELLAMQQHVELTPGLANNNEDAPLSYSQLQMFTLQTLTPESTAYNIVRAVQVSAETPYCRAALSATCDVLLTKHEALRTLCVTNQCGEPRQRVMPLQHFESSKLFQELQYDPSRDLDQFIAEETATPFDLACEAPIRVYAIATGASNGSWVLVTVIHHIATDPESSSVFWSDLTALYTSFQREPPCEREQLLQSMLETVEIETRKHVSYRDYAQWQRRRLQSGMLASSLQYWIHQLSHEDIPQLELPYDRPVPAKLEGERRGRTVTFQSSPQLQQSFSSLCASHGSSMFIGLMSIFHMLLSRVANCDDIVIGAPTAGRSHDALCGLMGYFVNTLPFRLQSQHDDSFVAFLETVKRVVVDGFSHMEIPLQKMLEHVQLDRKSSQNSVFSTMFAWEGGSEQAQTTEWKELPLPHDTAKFDLMLSMRYATNVQGYKVLEGTLEYPVDVFDRSTIERFTQYFLELASQVTQFPATKKLSEIQIIPTEERETMLSEWGVPPVVTKEPSEALFLDECVRRQAECTPGNIALRFEGKQWTYAQLWQHSSKLAVALQADKEVESSAYPLAGVRVGLFVDRGLENIASIIGVLQAKAVFIPLDPEFPVDRIQYMIQDSRAEVVITQRHLVPKLASLLAQPNSVRILICEDAFEAESTSLPSQLPIGMDPVDTIAYILYTSGSTGKPKGVMVTHANILTTLQWSVREYAVTHDDIFLQSTSSTLDGSLTQLFTPLLAGASALVTKKNGLHDLAYLAGLLTSHRVTCCVFVPSYFAMLIDYMGEFPQYVKHVVLAGEAFPTALATKFYEKHARYCEISGKRTSTTCLVNEYGPTEASVTSTYFRYPCEMALADEDKHGLSKLQSVPIGRGNDDHFVVVLDKHQRLVPTNVPGELFVGGRGVAKGYWGRPDLTEKTFFNHDQLPWTQQSRAMEGISCGQPMRWYKTGDLVKWLPCGELLFLGRTDSQVKLRGMRIELQEVRNVLLQSPQIKDAEVLVVNQRLVGYVILASVSVQSKQISELREYLGRRLPVHMVPHEILVVDQWPRTPNGKLDLRALAQFKAAVIAKDTERGNQDGDEEANAQDAGASTGSTIVVDILKQAWREVLDVDDEATLCRASFFELGGNSLSAIRVISLVKPHGLALKLESFFRCKTLLEMAIGCSTTLSAETAAKTIKNIVIPLNWKPWQQDNSATSPRSVPLFLVHCADGTVWKMMELARRLPIAVFGLQAAHGGSAASVEELAKSYWREIKAVQRSGPYRIGGFSFGCRIAHAIAMLGHEEGAQFLPLALLDGVPFHYQNRRKSKASEGECPEETDADDADGNVTEYVAKALGFKPSPQQPQDGQGKHDHVRDPERELFDQLVTNYETHCELDHMYRPCASGNEKQGSIQATLFKTVHWSLDEDAYRQLGMGMQIVDVEGEHLTMLRTPYVDSVARALLSTL